MCWGSNGLIRLMKKNKILFILMIGIALFLLSLSIYFFNGGLFSTNDLIQMLIMTALSAILVGLIFFFIYKK